MRPYSSVTCLARTSRYVPPQRDAAVVLLHDARGARHSLLSASRQAVAGGPGRASYAWNEPLAPKQKLSPEDRYSPFVSGGTVLFRPAPEVKKLADLGPVTMLFPDWAQYVAPALALFQSSPEIFKRDTEFRGSFAVAGTARAR